MKNSRILLLTFVILALCSFATADSDIKWENIDGWRECGEDGCDSSKNNAGVASYDEFENVSGGNAVVDTEHTGVLFGGFSEYGNASSNEIKLTTGAIAYEVYGGHSFSGETSHNRVIIENGAYASMVYGGETFVGENANYNKIKLESESSADLIYGGFGANASYNKIKINNSSVSSGIYGGWAAQSSNNKVKIENNSQISGDIYGGYSYEGVSSDNEIIITGGSISGKIYAGYTEYAQNNAIKNQISISGGQITNDVYGGWASSSADENKIKISGGSVSGDIIAGAGTTGAINNQVFLNGNNLNLPNIYGGQNYDNPSDKSNNFVSGNTLAVRGIGIKAKSVNNFEKYIFIVPKDVKSGDVMLEITGGNVTDLSGAKVRAVLEKEITLQNGDEIVFLLNKNGITGSWSHDKTITADIAGTLLETDIDIMKDDKKLYAKFEAQPEPQTDPQNPTDPSNPSNPTTDPTNPQTDPKEDPKTEPKQDEKEQQIGPKQDKDKQDQQAQNQDQKLEPKSNPKSMILRAKKEAKSLVEGSAASAALIIEAGSIMADKGISSAMSQTDKLAIGANKLMENFGAIGGGVNRYETGSYVDSKSINIVAGVALGQEVKYGKVLVGPFIELGYSDYETHNDFSTGHVRGDGISKYLGGGIFARYDWNSYDSGHLYVEGSVRFGKNKNSFDSTDLAQSYKSNAFYYGAHLGLGYIVEFQNNSSLDFYAKYFYIHLNSDDVTTNQGANLNLDGVNSHKTRFGARYNHALNNSSEWQIKPYVGLAWEHEYKGAANATTSGYAIEAPSLEGSSGMAEIGVTISKEKGLSADLGVAGYAGKRRGVSGNIIVKYEF